MTIDTAELEAKARAATQGVWTNYCEKRGAKKSVWIAESAKEEEDIEGGPSRYGSSREYLANFLVGHKVEIDPYANAAFCVAANPAAILSIISELSVAREENARLREALQIIDGRCVGARNVTRPILEAYWKGDGN